MLRRVGHCGQFSVIWEHSTEHIFMSIVCHPLIWDTYYHSRHIHTIYSLCMVLRSSMSWVGLCVEGVTLAHNSIWNELDHFRVEMECLVSFQGRQCSDVKHSKVLFHERLWVVQYCNSCEFCSSFSNSRTPRERRRARCRVRAWSPPAHNILAQKRL